MRYHKYILSSAVMKTYAKFFDRTMNKEDLCSVGSSLDRKISYRNDTISLALSSADSKRDGTTKGTDVLMPDLSTFGSAGWELVFRLRTTRSAVSSQLFQPIWSEKARIGCLCVAYVYRDKLGVPIKNF